MLALQVLSFDRESPRKNKNKTYLKASTTQNLEPSLRVASELQGQELSHESPPTP